MANQQEIVSDLEEADDAEREQILPELEDGELAEVLAVSVLEKKTRPRARYTEGTLIKDMIDAGKYLDDKALRAILRQVKGLGTSATRHTHIETLKHHGYLQSSGKQLSPTGKGEGLIGWLDTHCPELTDIALTARWEAELDAVAIRGGGSEFESATARRISEIVTTLRTAAPMKPAAGMKGTTVSQPSQKGYSNKPTGPMLNYAKKIAAKIGEELPAEVAQDFDQCRAYIDEHKEVASRPSDKALDFARTIAQRRGIAIPEDRLTDGKALSRWIDENK